MLIQCLQSFYCACPWTDFCGHGRQNTGRRWGWRRQQAVAAAGEQLSETCCFHSSEATVAPWRLEKRAHAWTLASWNPHNVQKKERLGGERLELFAFVLQTIQIKLRMNWTHCEIWLGWMDLDVLSLCSQSHLIYWCCGGYGSHH